MGVNRGVGVVQIECYGSGGHFGQVRIRGTTANLGVSSGEWDELKQLQGNIDRSPWIMRVISSLNHSS